MKTIRAVGFDFTGVLYGEPATAFLQGAANCLGISLEEYYAAYFRRNHELNIEKVPLDVFWLHVAEEAGKPDRGQALYEYVMSRPAKTLNKEMIDLARQLKAQGYKIGILSNNTPQGAKNIRAQGMEDVFDAVLVSSELGLMKPDPEVFQRFCEALGMQSNELVYIDDSENSLRTAEEVGYTPILFTGKEALLRALEALGLRL